MKFFAGAAVLQVVSAACGIFAGTTTPAEECDQPTKQCVAAKVTALDSTLYKPGVPYYDPKY